MFTNSNVIAHSSNTFDVIYSEQETFVSFSTASQPTVSPVCSRRQTIVIRIQHSGRASKRIIVYCKIFTINA